jgi:hypothetical protein
VRMRMARRPAELFGSGSRRLCSRATQRLRLHARSLASLLSVIMFVRMAMRVSLLLVGMRGVCGVVLMRVRMGVRVRVARTMFVAHLRMQVRGLRMLMIIVCCMHRCRCTKISRMHVRQPRRRRSRRSRHHRRHHRVRVRVHGMRNEMQKGIWSQAHTAQAYMRQLLFSLRAADLRVQRIFCAAHTSEQSAHSEGDENLQRPFRQQRTAADTGNRGNNNSRQCASTPVEKDSVRCRAHLQSSQCGTDA